MGVANPADLPLDVDRTKRGEPAGAGVDAQVTGEVLTVGGRRGVEDGVRVERTVHAEIQVGHSAVAGRRQHLGQHRHDAVLVFRQPHVPTTRTQHTHPSVPVSSPAAAFLAHKKWRRAILGPA